MSQRRGGNGDPAMPVPAAPPDPHDRVKFLTAALVIAIAGVVFYLLCGTISNLYKGTGSGFLGPDERPAVAQVHDCTRTGPVSRQGFGYWWRCRVTVRVADGRTVQTTVDRSKVTPADAGRDVEFREACKDGTTHCSYGRPTSKVVKGLFGALGLVEWLVLLFGAFVVVVFLWRGLLGVRRYNALYDRADRDRD